MIFQGKLSLAYCLTLVTFIDEAVGIFISLHIMLNLPFVTIRRMRYLKQLAVLNPGSSGLVCVQSSLE